MTLLTVAFPILPGRTDQWRRFVAEINGPRRADYEAWAHRFDARWQLFLQQTPQGDLVLVTAEGANPAQSFQRIGADTDAFTEWFVHQVLDIHGVDFRQPPPGPLPELVLDSQAQPEQQPAAAVRA